MEVMTRWQFRLQKKKETNFLKKQQKGQIWHIKCFITFVHFFIDFETKQMVQVLSIKFIKVR